MFRNQLELTFFVSFIFENLGIGLEIGKNV